MLPRLLATCFISFSLPLASASTRARDLNFEDQIVFDTVNRTDSLFSPPESLSSLSASEFTILGHPFFPHYSVRVKKSHFCDETVNAYTGYIDIEARHLFFYFFESRNDPSTDDVIFWTNGGPGCSSSMGLFMELGPCRIPDANGTVFHPESWNTNANVFFIDQPVGVGFSYAEYGEYVDTSEEAAKDVAAFVAIFFENFDQFKGRTFHMAGESYGGRYLPLFASAVYDQNSRLTEAGLTPINLQSVVIGNGLTDTFGMVLSYYDMQCTKASAFPLVVDIESCVAQKALLKRCETWMKASCEDQYDAINCRAAYTFCSDTYSNPFLSTGMNPYDMSKVCEGDREETLCYPQNKFISDYLDTPSVRTLLGVDSSVSRNFSGCSRAVEDAFQAKSDITYSSKYHVAALLERGIRFLIYVGTNDYLCNYVGNEKWTVALEWSGQSEFSKQGLRDWLVNGKRAGKTRSAQGFTYVTVIGAGHMVPFDKPQESLELIQRWIAGREL